MLLHASLLLQDGANTSLQFSTPATTPLCGYQNVYCERMNTGFGDRSFSAAGPHV